MVQFGMLTVASVLIYSGIKGLSVMDVLAGGGQNKPLDPAGGQPGALGVQGTPALPDRRRKRQGTNGRQGKANRLPVRRHAHHRRLAK
jgi:hypothetical protein